MRHLLCVAVAVVVLWTAVHPRAIAQPKAAALSTHDQDIVKHYAGKPPVAWGEHLDGIYERIPTDGKAIVLTFDACGRDYAKKPVATAPDYDACLVAFLRKEKVPATLFLNARWIAAHPDTARALAADPLFDIETHGVRHVPLSVTGRAAYGIAGTASIEEALREVRDGTAAVQALTGRPTRFFRSGTAFYDDIAIQIVKGLGLEPAGYSVLGDAGGTFSAEQVKQALLAVKPGDVVLMHMNKPAGQTADGVMAAVPILRERGFRFVTLREAIEK